MELQTALLIFIVIFALAIGFFLGLFLLSLDAPFLRKLFQKEESEESLDPGASGPPTGEGEQQPAVKKPTPDSKLVLRVWKEEGLPPVYEAGGKYLNKEALPKEILNIITVHQEAPPQPESPPEPTEQEPAQEAVQEVEEDDDDGEVKMLSVVDEVNDILQHKLHGSPMAGRGIHLMENHNKEIRFWVGLESYNDVSEIPDAEIQELINDAVREWEQNRS